MRRLLKNTALIGIASVGLVATAKAAPVTFDITATIQDISGTFAGGMSIGQQINGTYIFDTDENNASWSDTTPSTNPGHEYTSFYDFSGSPYSVSLTFPGAAGSFTNSAPVSVIVNNDLSLTLDDTGGLLAAGTYDWIEILGSTTSDVAPQTPGNGQEWTLALFADDANWFADGSVIPDSLPSSYTAILIGIDLDSEGNEIGFAVSTVDSVTISSVPIPAAVWLFGSGLIGLIGFARCKQA